MAGERVLDAGIDPHAAAGEPTRPCLLCGGPGRRLYAGLEDRLFGAPGHWAAARCTDRACGLIWLDPMPGPEALAQAYARYYTHAPVAEAPAAPAGAGPSIRGRARRAYGAMKRGWLALKLGYRDPDAGPLGAAAGLLLYPFPVRRAWVEEEVRHLVARPGGELLDVGCGSGAWLAAMRGLGWRVRGLDFDPAAVAAARARGIEVDLGGLAEQGYPESRFDALVLNHVIEHLPDPIGTLAECRRVLKPGGHLMVATPNAASLGHRVFKTAWRGLEPPRHLYLFSPPALAEALARGGFRQVRVWTTGSRYMWRESLALWAGREGTGAAGGKNLRLAADTVSALADAWRVLSRGSGECIAVRAVKT